MRVFRGSQEQIQNSLRGFRPENLEGWESYLLSKSAEVVLSSRELIELGVIVGRCFYELPVVNLEYDHEWVLTIRRGM